MAVAELDITSPRTLGRARREIDVAYARDLGEADLVLLASERGVQPKQVQRLRDRHHSLARCLAQGMKDTEASAVTGYDPSRISILKNSPDFANLVAHYLKIEDSLLGDFIDRATTLTLTAMNELQDRLEDKPETLSEGMLLEVAKSFADRTGHAPVQKNLNINANVNLGDRLQAARRRVRDFAPSETSTKAAPIPVTSLPVSETSTKPVASLASETSPKAPLAPAFVPSPSPRPAVLNGRVP